MTDKLKPCPFCGGEAEVYYAPGNDIVGIPCFGVACGNCKTMIGTVKDGTTDFFRTPQEAIKAWNTRKPMDKIVEQLEEEYEKAKYGYETYDESSCLGAMEAYEEVFELLKGVQNE